MTEFWEAAFIEKQAMWGFEPAVSAIVTKDLFLENGVNNVLIPGIGYGRNARIFRDNGMTVMGIEISQTAIDLARTHFGDDIQIYHGSVTDMPFDSEVYGGIFCFALIHLLGARERQNLIANCYAQLAPGGTMVFLAISKKAPMFQKGTCISPDRYETLPGVKLFFYDADSVRREFGAYGLVDCTDFIEPGKYSNDAPPLPFLMIRCRKEQTPPDIHTPTAGSNEE
jgi:SAM-dependent methyltransferase